MANTIPCNARLGLKYALRALAFELSTLEDMYRIVIIGVHTGVYTVYRTYMVDWARGGNQGMEGQFKR